MIWQWQEPSKNCCSYLWSWHLIRRCVQNAAHLLLKKSAVLKMKLPHWNSRFKGVLNISEQHQQVGISWRTAFLLLSVSRAANTTFPFVPLPLHIFSSPFPWISTGCFSRKSETTLKIQADHTVKLQTTVQRKYRFLTMHSVSGTHLFQKVYSASQDFLHFL